MILEDENIEVIPETSIKTKTYLKTTNFQVRCTNINEYNIKLVRERITETLDSEDNIISVSSEVIEKIDKPLRDLLKLNSEFAVLYENIDSILDTQIYK
jgi:hypothetical protein